MVNSRHDVPLMIAVPNAVVRGAALRGGHTKMSEAASALTHDKTYLILTHGDQPFYRGGAERQAGAPSPSRRVLLIDT